MEISRQLNDLALTAGRSYLSAETGFLHLCYSIQEEQMAHSIPLVENALFALALLKTKTQEGVLEGKTLLDKLLHFQAATGNFPIYIHEYPICHDRLLGARLLPIFYWILKQFQHVIGAELKERLEKAVEHLLKYILNAIQEKTAPDFLSYKIAAITSAFGKFFKDSDLVKDGTQLFQSLPKAGASFSWYAPQHLAERLIGAQMLAEESIHPEFYVHLANTWHSHLKTYVGPALRVFHRKQQPEMSAYDLFLGAFTGELSLQKFRGHFSELQGALVQPIQAFLNSSQFPKTEKGEVEGHRWEMHQDVQFAYSLIEKKNLTTIEKGAHPFYFVWGDAANLQTLALQGGNVDSVSYQVKADNVIELILDLKERVDPEDRFLSREISFFTEDSQNVTINVEGKPSTTFNIGDKVHILHPNRQIALQFLLLEGEGIFKGHVMKGNRPSQVSKNTVERFAAYDWQIFLRTVTRTHPCKLKVLIRHLA